MLTTGDGLRRRVSSAASEVYRSRFQTRDIRTRCPPLPASLNALRVARPASHGNDAGDPGRRHLRQRVETQIIERHAPAHVVTTPDGEILYFSAGTGPYLESPRGAPHRPVPYTHLTPLTTHPV